MSTKRNAVTFRSENGNPFRALAAFQAREQNKRDVEAAKRLAKAAPLPKPKVGPKVARNK